MKSAKIWLREFLRRPQVTICLGILVCVCGLSEILEEIIEGYDGSLQAGHGLLAFGLVSVLKGLTELAEGIELVTIEIEEVEHDEARDAVAAAKVEG